MWRRKELGAEGRKPRAWEGLKAPLGSCVGAGDHQVRVVVCVGLGGEWGL